VASVFAQALATVGEAVAASGVPRRTLRRWAWWWREVFPKLPTWVALRGYFAPPPPDEALLPRSLVARLEGDLLGSGAPATDVMLLSARCLAPATTGSVVEGSRFVTAAVVQMAVG
jgi:hypothetical protein